MRRAARARWYPSRSRQTSRTTSEPRLGGALSATLMSGTERTPHPSARPIPMPWNEAPSGLRTTSTAVPGSADRARCCSLRSWTRDIGWCSQADWEAQTSRRVEERPIDGRKALERTPQVAAVPHEPSALPKAMENRVRLGLLTGTAACATVEFLSTVRSPRTCTVGLAAQPWHT